MYGYGTSGYPMETNDYLFSVFGKYCEGAVYGSEIYGYCYRDFDDKKLRVICLNTSEGDSLNASYECSPAQLLWFAQTLKSVGAKTGWNVIVLGHYPLDYVGMHDATAVVKAYVNGSSITVNGTAVNFSGSNNAKFIANFHGHTHCFKVARLNELNVSTKKATEYDAWRVGIPNSGFYRNNHQEGPNAYGLYFEEETTYDKVNDGVNDTAFVVNVITPSEEVIHSFCYGAGYDRAIGYAGRVWHKITSNLSNCTMTSVSSSVEKGKPFTATITPNTHCAISSVIITMGGTDITSSCYSDGQINISSVTEDIVITAKATIALACTNQIPISTDASGAAYGWKKDVYFSSSDGTEAAKTNSYATGFIPAKMGDVVRLKNIKYELEATGSLLVSQQRMCFYDSNKNFLGFINSSSTYFHKRVYKNNNLVQFEIDNTHGDISASQIAYFRMNAAYIGDDSIITVNEEIKYADEANTCVIVNSLINATTNNNVSTIEKGSAYNATIAANNGYKIKSVTITMDGIDITSTAYSNGVISIGSVTGNIIIIVHAINESANYINLLPVATDTDGNIYNNKGYKENTYLSSGNEGTKNGVYCSGFIPVVIYDTIYFRNCTIPAADGCRIHFYDVNKNQLGGTKTDNINYGGFTWDDNGNLTSIQLAHRCAGDGNNDKIAYVRFCCDYIGDDSIVTVNEEIIDGAIYNITLELNNTASSNMANTIVENQSYTSTISTQAGYILDTITVTMGGVDITASVYSNGVINIPSVTGNVIITASAIIDNTISYINQLPISTDASGAIYNGKGYKEDTYLSSGNEGSRTGVYCTGFIPVKTNQYGTGIFYLKNVGMTNNQSNHRLCVYNADKTYAGHQWNTTLQGNPFNTYGEDGNISTIHIPPNKISEGSYIRLCCGYLGPDSIITSNEPIE